MIWNVIFLKSLIDPLQISVNISGLQMGSVNQHGLHVHDLTITIQSDNVTTSIFNFFLISKKITI